MIKGIVSKLFERSFVRFLFVGGLNTAFGYGVYALLLILKLPDWLALFLATVAGVLFNFKTLGVLVFRNPDNGLIFRFVAVYAVTYLINLGGIRLLGLLHVNSYIAGAVMITLSAVLTYALNRAFVFRKKAADGVKEKA